MASYLAGESLNRASDHLTSGSREVRLHSDAPGNAGTSNRIGTIAEDVAATGWTDASSGVAETSADINFGVLDTVNEVTVDAYSVWDGSDFLGWGDVYQPGTTTVGVTVAAGRTFTLSSGTVEFSFSRP